MHQVQWGVTWIGGFEHKLALGVVLGAGDGELTGVEGAVEYLIIRCHAHMLQQHNKDERGCTSVFEPKTTFLSPDMPLNRLLLLNWLGPDSSVKFL